MVLLHWNWFISASLFSDKFQSAVNLILHKSIATVKWNQVALTLISARKLNRFQSNTFYASSSLWFIEKWWYESHQLILLAVQFKLLINRCINKMDPVKQYLNDLSLAWLVHINNKDILSRQSTINGIHTMNGQTNHKIKITFDKLDIDAYFNHVKMSTIISQVLNYYSLFCYLLSAVWIEWILNFLLLLGRLHRSFHLDHCKLFIDTFF